MGDIQYHIKYSRTALVNLRAFRIPDGALSDARSPFSNLTLTWWETRNAPNCSYCTVLVYQYEGRLDMILVIVRNPVGCMNPVRTFLEDEFNIPSSTSNRGTWVVRFAINHPGLWFRSRMSMKVSFQGVYYGTVTVRNNMCCLRSNNRVGLVYLAHTIMRRIAMTNGLMMEEMPPTFGPYARDYILQNGPSSALPDSYMRVPTQQSVDLRPLGGRRGTFIAGSESLPASRTTGAKRRYK